MIGISASETRESGTHAATVETLEAAERFADPTALQRPIIVLMLNSMAGRMYRLTGPELTLAARLATFGVSIDDRLVPFGRLQ
jgi:hypothetical protein